MGCWVALDWFGFVLYMRFVKCIVFHKAGLYQADLRQFGQRDIETEMQRGKEIMGGTQRER